MQKGYFKAAWGDIVRSHGWFRKVLLLALLSIIPVFGWVVVYGYVYGWARDMAWGVRRPMPQHVFGNEDGRLYIRGLSVFAVSLVFSLVPVVVQLVGVLFTGGDIGRVGIVADMWNDAWSWWFVGPVLGMALLLTSVCASVAAVLFSWVGGMRASIYGRVSAGFQLGSIWAMVRHDTPGLLRILGMALLWTIGSGLAVTCIAAAVVAVFAITGLFVVDGALDAFNAVQFNVSVASVIAIVVSLVTFSLAAALVVGYASAVANVFVTLLCARALGYWMLSFDVPHWCGQDDPMPFEKAAGTMPTAQ